MRSIFRLRTVSVLASSVLFWVEYYYRVFVFIPGRSVLLPRETATMSTWEGVCKRIIRYSLFFPFIFSGVSLPCGCWSVHRRFSVASLVMAEGNTYVTTLFTPCPLRTPGLMNLVIMNDCSQCQSTARTSNSSKSSPICFFRSPVTTNFRELA